MEKKNAGDNYLYFHLNFNKTYVRLRKRQKCQKDGESLQRDKDIKERFSFLLLDLLCPSGGVLSGKGRRHRTGGEGGKEKMGWDRFPPLLEHTHIRTHKHMDVQACTHTRENTHSIFKAKWFPPDVRSHREICGAAQINQVRAERQD